MGHGQFNQERRNRRKVISAIMAKLARVSRDSLAATLASFTFYLGNPFSSLPAFLIQKSESAEICGSPSSVCFVLFVVG